MVLEGRCGLRMGKRRCVIISSIVHQICPSMIVGKVIMGQGRIDGGKVGTWGVSINKSRGCR